MRSLFTIALLTLATSSSRADCDTGFDERTMLVTDYDMDGSTRSELVVTYFECVQGGLHGDPDLGWDMVHLRSRTGAELRVEAVHAAALRNAGVAR